MEHKSTFILDRRIGNGGNGVRWWMMHNALRKRGGLAPLRPAGHKINKIDCGVVRVPRLS